MAREYQEIPRAPVRNEKSGSLDVTDGYERKIENFRMASREEALRMHKMNQEAGKVAAYVQSLLGEGFWPGARRWRSRYVGNRMAKARQDHLAQLTDTRPVIDVSTAQPEYKQTANVIAQMIRARWPLMDADQKLVRAADIADCYGTGFWRLGASWPGEMNIIPCGPDQVMPIQPGFDIQESSAVLFRTWKSVWWIKQKFPFTTNGIEREILNTPLYGTGGNNTDITFNRPANIDELTWNGLAPGMKRLLGVRGAPTQDPSIGQYYKTCEIEELFVDDPTTNDSLNTVLVSDPFLPLDAHNWWYKVEPTKRLFPRKRHLVFAGSRLISDGPSPYWHGLYPFAMLQFNPVFWSFWGLSKYRDLLPVNIAMNEIVAAALDLVKRALNPVAMTKEGAVSQAAWKEFYPDLPGMKLRIGANATLTDALRYMPPPEIPAYVFDMLGKWLAPEFDRLSGALDVSKMQNKRQNPSGDTIDTMRDAQNTSLRIEERQMEIFLRDAGKQAVSNEIQFTSADYRMQILGESGLTREDFNDSLGDMLPEDKAAHPSFHKQFALTISAGSLRGDSKDRDKNVAVSLASKQLLPIVKLYETLEIANPEQVYQALVKQQQELHPGQKPKSGKRSSDGS